MNEQNRSKEMNRQNDKTRSVADRLPELTEGQLEDATKHKSTAWVWGLIGRYWPGDICDMGGVTLQKVSIDTIRCVQVLDHPETFRKLSMLRATCEKAGVCLELGPYAVVTPTQVKIPALPPISQVSEPERVEGNRTASADVIPVEANGSNESNGYNFGVEVV